MAPHDFDPLPYPFDGNDSFLPTADVESCTQRSLNDLQHCLAAVIGVDGEILAVNKRWNEFANAHSPESTATVGSNYLAVCDRSADHGCADARTVAEGLRAVARGDRLAFTHRYQVQADSTVITYLVQVAAYYEASERRVFIAHEEL